MQSADIILITGARGFIGFELVKLFSNRGYTVRALVRDKREDPGRIEKLLPFASGGIFKGLLPDEVDTLAFQGGVRAVVHCAYATEFKNLQQARSVNLLGTQAMIQWVRQFNIPQFVFLSSMAAHEEARSFYGRSKWQIEKTLNLEKDLIIKPGTVLGHGGVFQRTRKMIQKMPALPLFFNREKKLQTVWIEDLCEGIFQAVSKKLCGTFAIAEEEGVTMRDFYRGVAALEGQSPFLFPFPGDGTLYLLYVLEAMGVKLPLTSENLLGIKCLKNFDVKKDLAQLGIQARSFVESLKTIAKIEKR